MPGSSGLLNATAVVSGGQSGYAISGDLGVSWGGDQEGQLGAPSSVTPGSAMDQAVKIELPGKPVQLAAAARTGYALLADGTVWAWGYNNGALGNGTAGTGCTDSPVPASCYAATPVQASGLSNVVSIAAFGSGGGLAVKPDGTVWVWGPDDLGQLGQGTVVGTALTPVQVPGLSGVTAVAGGNRIGYALKSDGTVLVWGWNGWGQFGDGKAAGQAQPTPRAVPGLTGVTALAVGLDFTLALRSDGTVAGWGENGYGQLGTGPTGDMVPTPTTIPGLSGVTAVAAGYYTGYALTSGA